jgi:hypothetical protein
LTITTVNEDSANSRGTLVSSASNQDLADPFDESTVTWTEIISSTSEDWAGFYFNIQVGASVISNNAGSIIVQFAVGAASSEVRIATISVSTVYNLSGMSHFVPIPVSSGSRVSAAVCSGTSLTSNYISVSKVPASVFTSTPSFTVMDAGPYDLDSWNNTSPPAKIFAAVDPGTSSHTKGSYTELSFTGGTNNGNNILNGDSIGQTYDYLGFHFMHAGNSAMGNFNWLIDVAYGAASSETIFISDAYVSATSRESFSAHNIFWVPWGRASGDRISMRAQASGTTTTDRLIQVTMYGLR